MHVILVPTDFAPASDEALVFAQDLARKQGARIFLLHVVQAPLAIPPPPAPEADLELERREMRARARLDLLRKGLPPGSDYELTRGDPTEAILAAATRIQPDLIVMATRGRTGLARALLGSVAESVLRRARCPVACVPPGVHATA
jgi:nucleotide-binding universal stress UspA family protein